MPSHPTAPDPSSEELTTRVANFMRRADAILSHPLAQQESTFTVTFGLDDATGAPTAVAMDHDNVPVSDLVYVATLMRPIVYLRDDPISLAKLTGLIEREHAGFRGKLKRFRQAFEAWLKTPILTSWTLGDVPSALRSDRPTIVFMQTPPAGTLPNGIELTEMTSDMHYALVYFHGEFWHSDDEKAAEYAAASDPQKQFIAKCAEVRTMHAIPFVRSLHTWVTEVRGRGIDI